MYEIKVKSHFSAAHNLKNYRGKCEHLHVHNLIVEAVFSYDILDKSGIAVDFRKAKKMLNDSIGELDHSYLNDIKSLKKINPTSENIARFIYERIKRRNKSLTSVIVWENENSSALYRET